ncbi:hypothetical protein M3P21_21105 [Ruegeria sp. 2012CJ41-6]|uniref:Uncharacterized protein n=1 Tax=Ruegeria spongiae TaxID=2942209 RepID=A0ABT0QA30_9RHOB|nr:hypothetical protein [Ruegeria spongiae]MCL6286018.1 hypothetical protein [Ruegeria spongiae]
MKGRIQKLEQSALSSMSDLAPTYVRDESGAVVGAEFREIGLLPLSRQARESEAEFLNRFHLSIVTRSTECATPLYPLLSTETLERCQAALDSFIAESTSTKDLKQ